MANNAANVLDRKFEEEAEAWKPDHKLAMLCRDLEDYLRMGLRHFRSIREKDEAWSKSVQTGKAAFEPEIAKYLRSRYEWWSKPCDVVLECIQKLERNYNFIVSGAEEFGKARTLVNQILSTPIEDVISSMSRIAKGEYITL